MPRRSRLLAFLLAGAPIACIQTPLPAVYEDPSILAGWKAGAACSALFVAERPLEAVLEDELGGLPPGAYEIGDPVPDAVQRLVEVSYAEDQTPRIAAFREGFGCSLLPVGAGPAEVAALPPYPASAPPRPPVAPWPEAKMAALDAPLSSAFDAESYGEDTKTIGVVIVRDGRIIAERYRPGFGPRTQYRTWSVAKSLTGALLGVLVEEGKLSLESPVPIPEWDPEDPRARITVANLFHMSSGLAEAGAGMNDVYFGGADSVPSITGAPLEVAPGSRWLYANRDTLLLLRAMRAVLGDEQYWTLPRRALFDRIGMHDTVAETDWHGNFVLSSQVRSTARDLARFGQLLLQDGVWEGERVLPEGWVATMSTPAPARATGAVGLWQHGLLGLLGYGGQLWLFDSMFLSFEGVSALGSRGQMVTVVPEERLVVVRTGLDSEVAGVFFRQDRFVGDVIEALKSGGDS
jgi:CubicO group peptidase (beta-lactamase class C family)